MKLLFCKLFLYSIQRTTNKRKSFSFLYFSNHLHGQDFLHIDVYDKDLIFDDKIGSVKIDLTNLYKKGFDDFFCFPWKNHFLIICLGRLDNWYELTSKFSGSSRGQIHLILLYQPLKL